MKPKYQMIASEIREMIIHKQFIEDQPLPTEIELQNTYKVSRQTIRNALSLLVSEGYLYKKRGSGTYINTQRSILNTHNTPTKTIGVITTYISDYIFPSIIRGIEEELTKQGYSLILSSTNNNVEQELKCLEKMVTHNVDGLIIEPTKSNLYNPNIATYVTLKELEIPILMINSTYEELEVPCLRIDDIKICYESTSELIKNGHKNILFITKIDDLQGKYRMKGFIKACEENKLNITNHSIITYTTETSESICEIALKSIHENPEITGIVCYNDAIAKKIIDILIKNGYSIPNDLSIVGHDNSHINNFEELTLTTIEHPKELLGIDAAKSIISAIETGKRPKGKLYPPQIVKGNTVKRILP
ncbi:GntR family transcriptional regulator [Streptococcus suis]